MIGQATLYRNARIFTMDRGLPRVEALVVQDGRIAALGPRDLVEREVGPETRRVDLDGQTVVPGFNDCHCHILNFGLALGQLQLGPDSASDIEGITRLVGDRAARAPEGEWIIGRGYDQNRLRDRRHPTRADLDAVSHGRPVVLYQTSGHALTCNSRALELAGITAATDTPPGGDIDRDAHGEPTGVLKEDPAMTLLKRVMPETAVAQGREAIVRAMKVMSSQGVTSATDAATGEGSSIAAALQMYRDALSSGRLVGRITLMPQITYVAPPGSTQMLEPDELWVGRERERLRIGATKIFSDGALTTRTAALREPFADSPDNTGLLIWEPKVLGDMIRRAHLAGWQIGTHAIGDRAIQVVLDCYEAALKEKPRGDHRHRIEHCMLLDDELAQRIRQLGVVPTIQPGFIARLGDAYVAALGEERAAGLMPMQTFDWLGIPVGFSSDRPVIPGAPLEGIASALQRTAPSGARLGPRHTITALEAIRHYTAGSAYAENVEEERGTLRRGMMADFAVLSRDPSETLPDEFDQVRVTMTVVDGVEVFTA